MKKKIILITILIFLTGFFAGIAFRSNYKIISPFEKVIRTPVSEITPTPIKKKQNKGTGAQEQSSKGDLLLKFTKGSNRRLMAEKVIDTFPEEAETFLAITWSESKFENQASSWCCHGIMQVHEWEHRFKIPTSHNETREGRIAWLRNPDNNLKIAKILYNDGDGKWHWDAYSNKTYKQYL